MVYYGISILLLTSSRAKLKQFRKVRVVVGTMVISHKTVLFFDEEKRLSKKSKLNFEGKFGFEFGGKDCS